MSTTFVSASTASTVKATISKLKIYFNEKKLNGNVLSYKNEYYVPVDILKEYLGYEVSKNTKTNKLTILENVNKSELQSQINKLKSEVKDLNEKLELYRGDIPDDSAYKQIEDVTYTNQNKHIYNIYWNKVTPFKINEKIYDKNMYGIYLPGRTDYGYYDDGENYPTIYFPNKNLDYSKFKFSIGIDDLAKSYNYAYGTKIKITGYSYILGNDILFDQYINRSLDIETFEVDIKGYDKIGITFIPYYEETFSEPGDYFRIYYPELFTVI